MGLFDTKLEVFEIYNQPLNEDPNSADLIGPALVAMKEGEDFMEHVKLTLIAILGRKDIHKFQNVIEDGKTPSFELPDSRITLYVEPTAEHLAHVPGGATALGAKVGDLQEMDWIHSWMFENHPTYSPCPGGAMVVVGDDNDGDVIADVIGAVFNEDRSGYHIVYVAEHVGENTYEEVFVMDNVTIPLAPVGKYNVVYYQTAVPTETKDLTDRDEDGNSSDENYEDEFDEDGNSNEFDPVFEGGECGVTLYAGEMDFAFGEESGKLVTFPPLPVRRANVNYYDVKSEEEQHDIERLGKIVGVKTKFLIDDIMESEGIVGEEEKVDDVYVSFNARIHDNSLANCRYLYLFFDQVLTYGENAGSGFFVNSELSGYVFDVSQLADLPSTANCISVRSGDYWYQFSFTHVERVVSSVGEMLGDENLKEQYEDRIRTTRSWFVSSSAGDGSAGEDYEQPIGSGEYISQLLIGEGAVEGRNITFYKCEPGGQIVGITVYGFSGVAKVVDYVTGVGKQVLMNPEDPNSIVIPYIPAIGEKLTNHELSDCFTTSLHVSIYVADITVKKLPWWGYVIMIVIFVIMVWSSYGAGVTLATAVMEAMVQMIIGYVIGKMVVSIAGEVGGWTMVVIAVVVFIASRGMSSSGFSLSAVGASMVNMSLMEILSAALQLVSNVVKAVQADDIGSVTSRFEDNRQDQNDKMLALKEEQEAFAEESGGFVGIEPLLDGLIDSSIRTMVNPMDPGAYFDMFYGFTDIGVNLIDVEKMVSEPINIDAMMQPV